MVSSAVPDLCQRLVGLAQFSCSFASWGAEKKRADRTIPSSRSKNLNFETSAEITHFQCFSLGRGAIVRVNDKYSLEQLEIIENV